MKNRSVLQGHIIGEIRDAHEIAGWRFVEAGNVAAFKSSQQESLVRVIKHNDIEFIETV
ncbi:MAG: hypothetical protein QM764_21210 [Chitinophagaceae bacterium]